VGHIVCLTRACVERAVKLGSRLLPVAEPFLRPQLSWCCDLPRRVQEQQVSPYWLGVPSSSLARLPVRRLTTLDLEVFPAALPRALPVKAISDPSTKLRHLQSLTTCRPPRLAATGATHSHEVSGSFSTMHLSSPLDPSLPHSVRSACRVSHPPDGLLLGRLPGLVSCRCAHGVPNPSELFPRPEPKRLSTLPCPLAVRRPGDPSAPRSGSRAPVRVTRHAAR
jgi:hypothetical protein